MILLNRLASTPVRMATILLLCLISPCYATDANTVPAPYPAVTPNMNMADSNAVDSLMDSLMLAGKPHAFYFCRADKETGLCQSKLVPNGAGLGGLWIPLYLEVSKLVVSNIKRNDSEWTFDSKLYSKVDRIPPLCGRPKGRIYQDKEKGTVLELAPFYCNWMVIGNVVNRFSYTLENVSPEAKAFSGTYRFFFNGTGNGFGTGQYRAFSSQEALTKAIGK